MSDAPTFEHIAYEGVMAFLEKRDAAFPMRVSDGMPDFFPWWDEREFS